MTNSPHFGGWVCCHARRLSLYNLTATFTHCKKYCDPYDLLNKIEQEFLDELLCNMGQSIPNGFEEIFTYMLVSIKADGEVYRTLFSENGAPHFPGEIVSACYQKFIAMEKDKRFHELAAPQKTWLFYFIAQGCSGVLNQWIENKMKEPISEVTDFVDTLIQNTLKSL